MRDTAVCDNAAELRRVAAAEEPHVDRRGLTILVLFLCGTFGSLSAYASCFRMSSGMIRVTLQIKLNSTASRLKPATLRPIV